MRRRCVFGVLMIAAVTGAGAPHAQTSTERVWTGTWEEQYFAERHSGFTRTQTQVTYRLTEGTDATGGPRWTSRVVQWSYRSESADFNTVAVEQRPPDARGFTMHRFRQDRLTTCTSAGSMELGPSLTTDRVLVPKPEQEAQLQAACVTDATSRETGETTRTTSTGDRVGFPGIPGDTQFQGCQYAEAWRRDLAASYYEGSASVSISAPVAALVEVDPNSAYGRFIPRPGEMVTFTARVPSGTARFRFELDPEATSSFPGYATNAYIDDRFFAKYPQVQHLSEKYIDVDPDLIFDPAQFSASQWSRAEFLVVETARPQGAAVVTVTAMDYGAVGRLRAFVKSEGCGDWQPVPVRFGNETRDSVSIPLDEDDNLIADALEDYHFLESGADDDAEPKGNGMAGDGLTAFEEYRGFLIRGADCGESVTALHETSAVPAAIPDSSQEHVRTPPHHKNLFVFADDPLLATFVGEFGWASSLSALPICEEGYGSNGFRVVNYTLQEWGAGSTWQGHTVTREPQHGLWLRRVDDTSVPGLQGLTVGVGPDVMGPPKLTTAVEIAKPLFDPGCPRGCGPVVQDLMITTRHELGHAVGVPHHGDDVVEWRTVPGPLDINPAALSPRQRGGGVPDFARVLEASEIPDALLVEPGLSCTSDADDAAFGDEALTKFVGCLAANIIRRGQQHSGDMWCPMRYPNGDRYEAPGSAVLYLWSGVVHHPRLPPREIYRNVHPVKVDAWGGRVLKYQNSIDDLNPPLQRLCTKPLGTGINAGDLNHAGDNGRRKSCSEFVVVKDSAAPGVQ